MKDFLKAQQLLKEFKGDSYLFGTDILAKIGKATAGTGEKVALVRSTFAGSDEFVKKMTDSLAVAGVELAGCVKGSRPNSPAEDVCCIAGELKKLKADAIIVFGGGSTIDAAKAAQVIYSLDGKIDDFFGTGLVTQALKNQNKSLVPLIAVQAAASSASHLTKYANVTDLSTAQKSLIVDPAIVPGRAFFDYQATYNAPQDLTVDGGLDGFSHCLEVLYGAVGKPHYEKAKDITATSISLIVNYLPNLYENLQNKRAREALCLATDLGGYAIMIGGTNGGHLTSFSLVDVLTHGRACAIMNPYYSVLFARAIQQPLELIAAIFSKAGLLKSNIEKLDARELAVTVGQAMLDFTAELGIAKKLTEVKGFGQSHIDRALKAAKTPQLQMKLQNMPIALSAEMIDEYMGSVLEAAKTGSIEAVKSL